MEKFTGTVEELGISIFMQGTHKLLDDKGEQVALLQAADDSLDLNDYVGQKVELSGTSAPAVEGGATFVSVASVSKV